MARSSCNCIIGIKYYLSHDQNSLLSKDVRNASNQMLRYLPLQQYAAEYSSNATKQLRKFIISCDARTSPNHLVFLGIIMHYIDARWILRQNLIGFVS